MTSVAICDILNAVKMRKSCHFETIEIENYFQTFKIVFFFSLSFSLPHDGFEDSDTTTLNI